ncbi:MAG: hypothetical protein E6F99_29610 [Actinobacteria bacterium]|nr:MAG: hypothetical protein E6F99_29610 [Actinomycetota bacterium]
MPTRHVPPCAADLDVGLVDYHQPPIAPARPRPADDTARIAQWQTTGTRPGMAIWTPAQLAAFLKAVPGDRLYGL